MARGQSRGQRANGICALCSRLFALRRYHRVRPARRRSAGGAAAPIRRLAIRDAIAEGEKLYNETCTACHGKDGTGGELGPPVAAQNRRYLRRTDQEIFDTIKNGITGTQMPPFTRAVHRRSDLAASPRTSTVFAARRSTRPRRATSAAGEAIFWGKGELRQLSHGEGEGRHSRARPLEPGGHAQSAEHRRRAHEGEAQDRRRTAARTTRRCCR